MIWNSKLGLKIVKYKRCLWVDSWTSLPTLVVIVVKENRSECKKKTSLRDPSSLSAGCQDWCWEARNRLLGVHFPNRSKFQRFWFVVGEERWNGNGNLSQQTPWSLFIFTEDESKTWLNFVFHFVLWWWEMRWVTSAYCSELNIDNGKMWEEEGDSWWRSF